jgi:hypothetical protein
LKDNDIIDTDKEITDFPKIHGNISPSGMTNVYIKIKEHLLKIVPGIVTIEFESKIRDPLADAPAIFTNALNEEIAGLRPNGNAGKAWDDEKKQRAAHHATERANYRADTNKAISSIHAEFLETSLKVDLLRQQAYTAALNNLRTGSILDYWNILQSLLKTRVNYMQPGKETSSVIIKQIMEIEIEDVGDAMDYFDKVKELLRELVELRVEKYQISITDDLIVDDEILALIKARIRQTITNEIDGDLQIIKRLWDQFSDHNDYAGTSMFKHLCESSNVKAGDTPFSNRIVNNNTVTGGITNMLVMVKGNLDRIKSNRPNHKILFKRKEAPIGRDLKINEANLSSAELSSNKKQKVNPTLPSSSGVDFGNKKADTGHCYYCRDQLCNYSACKTHCYLQCAYNLSEKGTCLNKKTITERKRAYDAAAPLRKLVQEGRQR